MFDPMAKNVWPRPRRVGLVLLLAVALATASARADVPLRENSSLDWTPADVGFYWASLRSGEQLEALVESRRFQEAAESPVAQMIRLQVETQWRYPQFDWMVELKRQLDEPINRQLVALLRSGLAQEWFIYGSRDAGSLIELLHRLNAAYNQLQFAESSDLEGLDVFEADVALAVLESLDRLPELVAGIRVEDPEAAQQQIDRLHRWLQQALRDHLEDVDQRLQRETLHGRSFLVLRLDGALLDLDPPAADGPWAPVVERLQATNLVLSLGTFENYWIVSVAEDIGHLERLGQPPLLIDADALASLRQARHQPLVSVGYASQEMMEQLAAGSRQFDQIGRLVGQAVAAEAAPQLVEDINEDLRWLASQLEQRLPEPGAVLSYSYLSPDGYETFRYDWSRNSPLDGSLTLPILQHFGGEPLLAAAWRARPPLADDYQVLRWIVERAFTYWERIGAASLDEQQRAVYQQLLEIGRPLVQRLDEVNREMLLPAVADRQMGIVVDARILSRQWHAQLPASAEPLPMPEIALLHGVADAALLRQAAVEYRRAIQQALDRLQQIAPGQVPELQLPRAEPRAVPGGTVYQHAAPAAWQLDPQLAPSVALNDRVVLFSFSPQQAERLIEPRPLASAGPFARPDQPLAAAVHVDCARLIEVLRPWLRYALIQAVAPAGNEPDDQELAEIMDQVDPLLALLQGVKRYASVTYVEGDALLTHGRWTLQD